MTMFPAPVQLHQKRGWPLQPPAHPYITTNNNLLQMKPYPPIENILAAH